MNKIVTLPVYSKLTPTKHLPTAVSQRMPENMKLSEHQSETYEAVISGRYDVVM